MNRLFILTAAVGLALAAQTATAGTLENLERERAMTIDVFLDPEIGHQERAARVGTAKRRLIDLERMVLRDQSLRGKNTRIVRQAFKNYDVTFMAHAAVEHNRTMVDNWLDQFGVSTDSLMAAKVGRR